MFLFSPKYNYYTIMLIGVVKYIFSTVTNSSITHAIIIF